MGIPTPASFPKETPEMAAVRAQRALEVMQGEKAQGEPIADAELARAAALPRAAGTPLSDTAGSRVVQFNGQTHQFPGDATDAEIAAALDSLAPQASQADVRASEPQPSPMESQKEKEARFADAMQRYVKTTGGTIPPGKNIRQAAEEWSGIQDPVKTRDQAETAEVGAGGDLQYGDSVPYVASKALAALGGFATGGPGGATAGEAAVRFTALAFNLKKAVDAGAIDEDRAAEIMAKEMLKGTSEDALFNFGLPLLGQIVMKIPGAKWLADKVAARIGATGPSANEAAQRTRAVDKLAKSAPTPAAQTAVQELSERTQGVIPTPGQVTGSASVPEQAARVVNPGKFDRASAQLSDAARGMREDLVNPATQPLRPTFEDANKLGVGVDLSDSLKIAEDALARNAKVPGDQLKPGEITKLQKIVDGLRVPAQPAAPGAPSAVLGPNGTPAFTGPVTAAVPAGVKPVDAEAALDFLSARKADTRAITADGVPSTQFVTVLNNMIKKAEESYQVAAANTGRSDVVKRLIQARTDYGNMMDTVYDDAVKAALKKNPEDVGRLFWQAGNVSEVQQLHKMLDMATKEGAMTGGAATKLRGDMVRGFLAEAMPDVGAAAKWSETLSAKPGLRDTWLTLTSTPGGSQLRGTMEVLEQAAKIAQREHKDLVGDLGLAAIPLSRAAGGGWGVSLVTGAFHPLIGAAGISVDVVMRMAATAYTQGNKGVLNATMRALRANSAGTAASAKILQETLPKLREYAQANNLGDLYVQAHDAAAQTQQ